jgi:16S rRNA (cytosine967-C5)-methyltransferase
VAADKAAILASQDAATLDTPRWMLDRWTEHFGAETARAIAESHLVEPNLDLTVKSDPEGWAKRLGGIVLPNGSVRLVGQGAVEKLDGYDEGAWWVQDAAATLPVRLLGPVEGRTVADLCAAPGGKTAMLAHLGAKVTAVDVSGHRLGRLKRNLTRLGLDADIKVADVTEFMSGPFDMVLLDAPCTATGTLRRHPDGVLSKKPADVASLAALQRKLLDQAIRLVRPGGIIVYSTCSLEPEEGPDQIRRLLLIDAPVDRVPVTSDEVFGRAEFVTPEGDVRTLPIHFPHEDPRLAGLDGFYAARLRRRS